MLGLSRLLQLAGRVTWAVRPRGRRGWLRRSSVGVEGLEARLAPALLGQQLFPADNPWNQNIASAPVAANSAAVIAHIGAGTRLTPNWGADNPTSGNPLYGMPVNIVHGNGTAKVNVTIDNYPGESDIVPVPIPANAVLEGDFQNGPNPNGGGYNANQRGDSHLIVWDEDANVAYELYGVTRPTDATLFPNTSGVEKPHTDGLWHAAQETVWNMNTDTFRTLGATSADAAGLSILAGLARPDEGLPVSQGGQGVINHALRVTLPGGEINPQYVYPASHMVSVSQGAANVPLGTRLRLANTTAINTLINNMPPESQIVARAMQQYGLIVADIGSAMYVSGASATIDTVDSPNIDLTWNLNDIFASNGLEALNAGDFQVVDLRPVVTGVSPANAAPGSTVIVTGQNFSGAAGHLSVFFGSTAATSVTVLSDTQVSVVVPNGSGTVNVTVQSGVSETDTISSNPNANVNAPIFGYGTSAVSSADQFTFGNGLVTLQSITLTPAAPTVAAGTAVAFTATGHYSDNSTQVLSGGVNWSSSATAVATIDASGHATTLTPGTTTITATFGSVSGSTTLTVTPAPAPTVTGISPTSGPATGGTLVTITGTGFVGVTAVSFGGTAATGFTVVSATTITATAPAGTAGQAVDLTVTAAGGTTATSAADKFTFTAANLPPANLHATPGNGSVTFSFDPVTAPVEYYPYAEVIGGTIYPIYVAFSNPFTITANNAGPLVNGTTHTFLVAITYANGQTSAWSSPATVTIGGGTTTGPSVSKVDPARGPAAGGTLVTIAGTGFTGVTAVSFGGTPATGFTVVSATKITTTAPAGTAGKAVDVTVTTAAGKSATGAADRFTYVGAPTITTQPAAVTVNAGQPATFKVVASGTGTLSYSCQKFVSGVWVNVGSGNTSSFTGATTATFTITSPVASDAGTFRVVVSNAGGSVASSGATLTVNSSSGGGPIVGAGQTLEIHAGQTVSGATVLPGGYLLVDPGGTDGGSRLAGGDETVEAGGQSIGTTIDKSGSTDGDIEIFGTGINLILNNGYINVDQGGKVTGTTINGDIMYVSGGGTATNTTIYAGGSTTVIGGGVDNGTVLDGGEEWVRSGAVTNGTTVNNGGIEYVFAGGLANSLTLNAGGSATMLGTVSGATINGGATVTVFDGGAATGAIVDNGALAFSLSGTDTFAGQLSGGGSLSVQGTGKLVVNTILGGLAVAIGNSSSLELGAAAAANVTFGYQSTLKLDVSQSFTGTIAATPGYEDVLDLGDVPFVVGVTSVQYVENSSHMQGVLTVSDQGAGGPVAQLTLLGDFSGAFGVAADGAQNPHPGTLITGPF